MKPVGLVLAGLALIGLAVVVLILGGGIQRGARKVRSV